MADASKILDAAMIGIALLPARFLSLTQMQSFAAKGNLELRKEIHDSAVRRLVASWLTWCVAVFYVALEAGSAKLLIGLEFGVVVFLVSVVVLIYQKYSLPKNRQVGLEFAFMAAPLGAWRLLPKQLRWSPFNLLVFIGILADVSIV